MTNHFIRLERPEIIEGRPFSNVEGSFEDLVTLRYMLEALYQLLLQPVAIPDRPRPLVLYLKEREYHLHRVTLSRPELLLKTSDLTVVGFCGRKRKGVDRGPIEALDRALIAEFSQYEELLSYSSLQLKDGNACNLVLFSQPQGIGHWATSPTHARAVKMSPDYYESVRLHHGLVPGGLTSTNRLELLWTKYYDYRDQPVWRAIRKLEEH
jgi:hypothetical protein